MRAFVGRGEEMRALEDALGDAMRGAGRLVLLTGEPGIGKTRLAEELAARAKERGCIALWGRTWEGEGTPAYWPWLQILRQLGAAEELAALFEAAHEPSERFRLYDAILGLFTRSERPLVLILDDLHSADAATLRLIEFVARSLRTMSVLVIGTARDASLHQSQSELLGRLAREALHMPLGRLVQDDLADWIAAAAPQLADHVNRLFATSEGNPLFVEELLAAPGALAHGMGLRAAIAQHLAIVSPSTQRILEIASVLGREGSVAFIRSLAGTAVDDALREAAAAGVASEVDGRFVFSHVLLRDELYARIAPERRMELHRAAHDLTRADPAVAAHHRLLGARAEDAAATADTVLSAMHHASSRLAFEDAAELGERAIARLAHLAPAQQCALYTAVGEALIHAGQSELGHAACARAADIASAAGDADSFARAALTAASEQTFRQNREATLLLKRALEALGPADSPLTAQVMARLSVAMMPVAQGEVSELLRLRTGSIGMARRVGDDAVLLTVLTLAATGMPEQLSPRERFAFNAETIALADRLGRLGSVLTLLGLQVGCWLELGEPDGAAREAALAVERLAKFAPHYRWRAPLIRALLATVEGRFAEADALGAEVLAMSRTHALPEGLIFYSIQRMCLAFASGDREHYADTEAIAVEAQEPLPLWDVFRAMPDAIMGRRESAQRALDRIHAYALESIPGPYALAWPCSIAGTREQAAFFYGIASAHQKSCPIQFGPFSLSVMGPTALVLGRLAVMLDRDDDAIAHFRDALALAREIRGRPFIAHTELAWAELCKKRGWPDLELHAKAARDLADELGMRTVRERADALLSPSGIAALTRDGETWTLSLGARRATLRDAKGLAYLDALIAAPHREIHVLDLVGQEDTDAGPLLDPEAKAAYRARIAVLRETIEEADESHDLGRAERARAELDALTAELTRAVGRGGRDRRAGSAKERARLNVQRRVKDAIRRVYEQDDVIGRHLEESVKTGLLCVYAPR